MVAAGCGKAELKPASIEPGDSCTFCKMAISEKRYAAQILDADGQIILFDEIGCMVSYLKSKPQQEIAVMYVTDYDSRRWIAADHAFFVHSSKYKTPMSGGIVAFQDSTKAKEEAARTEGEIWTSEQFLSSRGKS